MAIDYARWKPEQIAVARLLAEPDGRRWTNTDLAREAGVNPDTIGNWRSDDDFRALVNELAERVSDDHLAYINSKLIEAVDRGSIKAIELYYKKHGRLIDRKEVKGELRVESDGAPGSLDEINARIEELEKRTAGG